MTERATVAMAVAGFIGALIPLPIPLALAIAAAAAAVVSRRAMMIVLAVALLCSCLAWRSWAGLEPSPPRRVDATAMLVTDPVRTGRQTTAVIRIGDTRYLASAYGGAAARLQGTLAGQRVAVSGSTRPYGGSGERRAALHVAERLTVDSLAVLDGSRPPWSIANAIRSTIDSGAGSLGEHHKALFTGLVYGDDREQSATTEVDFRLVGLTHLLAVSGQNVAYALAVLGPAIRRFAMPGRWLATALVLLVFATATRFEPSVLRATAMAGLAVTAKLIGRDAPSGRLLAMAVAGLLIIDPLLAETMAFRLSVAASAGIVWLSEPIERRLPGPRTIRTLLAVTLSAQLAVSPLLVSTFGPVSVMSIPANVLAGPIAGTVMGWGMTAGFVAGIAPDAVATLIHLPTRAGLNALDWVARTGASVPVTPVGWTWIALACGVAATWRRMRAVRAGRIISCLIVAVLLLALRPSPPPGSYDVGFDSELIMNSGSTTLRLGSEGRGVALVVDLLQVPVRQIDTVVMADGAEASVVSLLAERVSVGATTQARPTE